MSTRQSDAPEVPPELRPYYREQAVAARTRHTVTRMLAILLLVGMIAAIVSFFWTQRHKIGGFIDNTLISMTTKQPAKPKKSGATAKKSAGTSSKNNQNKSVASNTSGSSATSKPPSPSPSPVPSPAPASGATTPSPSAPAPSPAPSPVPAANTNPSPAASTGSSAIPNTGPGSVAAWGAAICGIGAFTAYQFHIRRYRSKDSQ